MKIIVYGGKGGELSGKGHTKKIVMKLMEERLNIGHSLHLDNFYNSFSLATTLLQNMTYCTGTLQLNRKNVPDAVKSAKLIKGETVAQYSEGIMTGKWRDKRVVSYIVAVSLRMGWQTWRTQRTKFLKNLYQ